MASPIDATARPGALVVAALALAAAGAARAQCELQTLIAADPDSTDWFGSSVAGTATRVVVGAMQDSEAEWQGGAAYVFEPGQFGTWVQGSKLLPSDPAEYDNFGWSVALDGDTIVVGARFGDAPGAANAGSAYVFRLVDDRWIEEAKLVAPDAATLDWFGIGVAVSGDTALVGAQMQDEGAEDAGCAYVFVRDGGTWTMQTKLLAPDPLPGDNMGFSVDLDGDVAVVGAPHADDAAPDAGSVHVFRRTAGTWSWEALLTADDVGGNDRRFGFSVAVDGPRVLVGAPLYTHEAGSWAGAGYVFVDGSGTWTQEDKLVGSAVTAGIGFGEAVDLAGDRALIAAGNQEFAVAFERAEGTWGETWTLVPTVFAAGYGACVALAGGDALVGAPQDDVPPIQAGSVSVFDVARPPCPADVNDDCHVDFADVLAVIGAWGPCPATCPEDLSGNGAVDFADVLAVIAGWGACPP